MRCAFALILIGAVLPINGQEKSSQPAAHNESTEAVKKPSPPSPTASAPSVVTNQQGTAVQENRAKDSSQSYLKRMLAAENLPNLLLVGVGIGGIIITISTLKAIQAQTKAVLRSVVAIKRQTAVGMEAQSGRIAIYWDHIEHIDYGPTRIINGPLLHAFNWYCRNSGQTHIDIVKTWSRFIAIDSLLNLPERPDYSAPNERLYVGEQLPPDDKARTEWFSAILETALSFEEMQEKHRKRQCVLYAYGYVVYRNVWKRELTYRFGVVRAIGPGIMEDNWLPAGPRAYNSQD
jgi:hypothetical protein